ncbi:amino acid ABC transporter substrate-binding protein [Pseudoalteromonas rubra]|uniref:Amino acid ABC transporter substrate-binding protein n=1 Tax=Pseudoalteromonas rubra TaxID=43658 RepID=A0A5S3WLW6_9GAMM|nr:transporter substrate-binding domain-containing protein [Pseudoalteromonas rubra]TMP28553.1 amino acid ABC transporter substrate-binding protein [Pseudoalteromonas rubra]TMP30520.1 amino acid ABC transporter substrate-binding protein [Pseudoalteromonas rubra]
MNISQCLVICSILVSGLTLSKTAVADTLDVSVGWTKPPYVIEQGDTGFELDMVKAVFAALGHDLQFVYVPFGRSDSLLKTGKVDAALTMNRRMDLAGAVLSEPYITYHNTAISLKSRNLKLHSISALENYAVIGFQNASLVLGMEYQLATANSPLYIELPDQKKQVELLLQGKVDVVVMDINIFNYLSKAILGRDQMVNVSVHYLFPASPYRIAFRDPELKEAFNLKMVQFKNSPAYQKLLNRYQFLQ